MNPIACHNLNNPMNMIRHDDKFIHRGMRVMSGNIAPTFFNRAAQIIQMHYTVDNITEQ